MTTLFTAFDDVLSTAVTGMFGEAFVLTGYKPASNVNAPPIVDPARPAINVMAVWVEQAKHTPLTARGAMQDDNAHAMVDGHPMIHLRLTGLLWRPRKFDRVMRVSTGDTYQVSSPPRPDGMGQITLPLSMKIPAPVVSVPPSLKFNVARNSQYLGTIV